MYLFISQARLNGKWILNYSNIVVFSSDIKERRVFINVAPIGARGASPPQFFFLWKRRYFSFRLASLNRNCVQYYNTTSSTSVLYTVQCTLRKLQCKSKLTNTVCANVFTITVCTVHVLYNLCSISMYTYNRIFVL